MALRSIVTEGDDILTKKCREVTKFDSRLAQLIDDMRDTLREAKGVGLAAPQVGFLKRVVVIDTEGRDDSVIELVNPVITEKRGEQECVEGCLSCPGEWGITLRPEYAKVSALDRNGKEFTVEGEGLLAQALCHELDHLEGIIYKQIAKRMLSREEIEQMNKED